MATSFRDDFYNAFGDRYHAARVRFIEQKGNIRGQLDSAEQVPSKQGSFLNQKFIARKLRTCYTSGTFYPELNVAFLPLAGILGSIAWQLVANLSGSFLCNVIAE